MGTAEVECVAACERDRVEEGDFEGVRVEEWDGVLDFVDDRLPVDVRDDVGVPDKLLVIVGVPDGLPVLLGVPAAV